jgi:hypothetical protein
MKRRAGKTYYNSPWPLQDERLRHCRCVYCNSPITVYYVNDLCPREVCVGCYTVLVFAGATPAVAPVTSRAVSQSQESYG